jgi:hypothetical protein
LTRDPIKDGRNWYGYCENNPGREVDPEGTAPAGLIPLFFVPGIGQGLLIVSGVILIAVAAAATYDHLEARRSRGKENRGGKEHRGNKRNWDKHTNPRAGRPTEKKKQKPDWINHGKKRN